MFTHLHTHTEYSLLDGVSRIKTLIERAKFLGMDSLAITDHGNMHGAIEFYMAAKEVGIKPIIGSELYVATGSRLGRANDDKSPYHLTVLAKDMDGYRNLCQLITKANLEGFYYKPRVDKELLEKHQEGLVVLSGCLNGEVAKLIAQGQMDEAKKTVSWYKKVFGDYYLELQHHEGIPELHTLNKGLMEISKSLDIPVVATNDSHYVFQEEAPLQDILICIHTNTNIDDQKRLKMDDDSYYLKSPQEMAELFKEVPESISNTQMVAEKCNLVIPFGQLHLPEYKTPNGMSADEYLQQLCEDGLRRRFKEVTPKLQERLAYEMDVIRKTKFSNYFLVVWDISFFARRKGILYGVRGSAAASLVLYCLGITDIDPIDYALVFERFLNIERKEMPDIDMDFQDDRREEVIRYLVQKYGPDNVAQIITFGTLGAKAAIRDVGRALAMPYADVDRVARLIPNRLHMTLDQAMEESAELKEIYEADETLHNLVDTARKLEGTARHASTHAAGVVISKDPVTRYAPLQRPLKGSEEDSSMTQYPMDAIAKLGLLKMDVLGLINLTILDKATRIIEASTGKPFKLNEIPLDDKKTFELLSSGDTANVFQLESTGMRRYIRELKPTSIRDVAAMIALYRPGPMEHISTFIEAKHGRAPIKFPHEALKEILQETYGVIVYQDQVLIIARTFAGYTLGEADIVRKAMGKKIAEVMRKEKEKFIQGSLKQGYTEDMAKQVFELIEPFAGYAFNKAHSMSYAMISYWTGYLKANYPVEYMTAVLNSYYNNAEKMASTIIECRRLKIPVLPPDINRSGVDFVIERRGNGQDAIRFGMAAIKNVGVGAVQPIIEARVDRGPFKNIDDFCSRTDLKTLNRRTLESLIKVGALDRFGERASLLATVDRIISMASREAKLRESGQATMFNLFGESVSTPLGSIELPKVEVLPKEKLAWEMELLGVDLSENPMSKIAYQVSADEIVFKEHLEAKKANEKIILVGRVVSAQRRVTREQKPFMIASVGLMDGQVEVAIWSELLSKTGELWAEGNLLRIAGRVRVRNDQRSVTCSDVSEYDIPTGEGPADEMVAVNGFKEITDEPAIPQNEQEKVEYKPMVQEPAKMNGKVSQVEKKQQILVSLQESKDPIKDEHLLKDVISLLLEYQGDDVVKLEIATNGKRVFMDLPNISVNCSQELLARLEETMGYSGVKVEPL